MRVGLRGACPARCVLCIVLGIWHFFFFRRKLTPLISSKLESSSQDLVSTSLAFIPLTWGKSVSHSAFAPISQICNSSYRICGCVCICVFMFAFSCSCLCVPEMENSVRRWHVQAFFAGPSWRGPMRGESPRASLCSAVCSLQTDESVGRVCAPFGCSQTSRLDRLCCCRLLVGC